MAFPNYLINVSEDWLGELERAAQREMPIPPSEILNLISHVRGLRHDRDRALAETESFKKSLPPLTGACNPDRRDAWARLGWIVA